MHSEFESYRELTAPTDADVQALYERVRATGTPKRHRTRAVLAGALVAAAALFAITLPGPEPVDMPLTDASVALGDFVRVDASGHGAVVGQDRTWDLTWDEGAIHVDVVPDQGVALSVNTPDAKVTVVGTVFDVTKDIHGTAVRVARGKVRVECTRGPTHLVTGGHDVRCRPGTPASALRSAHHWLEEGATDEVLEDLREMDTPDPVVQAEIIAARADAFGAQQPEMLYQAIDAYLDLGGPRAADLEALGGIVAAQNQRCDLTEKWLQPTGELSPQASLALGVCLVDRPEQARPLLERAAAHAETADLANRWLAQLP